MSPHFTGNGEIVGYSARKEVSVSLFEGEDKLLFLVSKTRLDNPIPRDMQECLFMILEIEVQIRGGLTDKRRVALSI